ncbi:MAG: hypothetical protein QF399_00245 [Gammaproteobacteria bacterium]|jgi:hypothetical protein|nr:hypothetical protein [Gammaproteobacteria bacterium]|tara:strand:- start:77 stop:355 length:279 start_codon:yes stop_codon:yes gene_type:complete
MSVARITTVTFSSEEAADKFIAQYAKNAVSDFPEAEQLLTVKADSNIVIGVGLFPNNETLERASAARKKILNNPDILSIDAKVGSVEVNHTS